jgi:hypothetical protein
MALHLGCNVRKTVKVRKAMVANLAQGVNGDQRAAQA